MTTTKTRKSEAAQKMAAINAKHEREMAEIEAARERMSKTTSAPSDNRVERAKLANVESKTLKQWEANGCKGKRPETVNLDAILIGQPVLNSTNAKTSKRSSSPRVEQTVQLSVNGRDQKGSHNRLSTCAARAKISADVLRALLDEAGITDPLTTRWEIEVNGKTIAARLHSDAAPEPVKAQRTSKQSTAKSTPASKRVVDGISGKATKSAAKRTPAAKRQVTPIPKPSAAKRTRKATTRKASK